MMKKATFRQVLLLLFGIVLVAGVIRAEEEFSVDRAHEHLRHIAGLIGPRPLGSPQELAALSYFALKLEEYGCEVEWQPVKGTGEEAGQSNINTSSFNVIGRLPGQSTRQIVVGAHIDSASPEIPGADDDGSGIAVLLELARVLSGKPHQATVVFVAFCGEEAGLVGSKSFVRNYPLKDVALMLQLDMTSNDAPLMLWLDTKKGQSPTWLVDASIDAFHRLGYRRIDYPTLFQTINGAFDGAGSDHEPFLEKEIPAIAFVSDVRFPIHTPNDSLEYFQPKGLERSGRLILELLRKFDRGQPPQDMDRYMLVMVDEKPFYIRPAWLTAVILMSFVAGLAALIRLYSIRKLSVEWEADRKVKKSWPKLLLLHLLILAVTFASLWVVLLITGHRVPWYAHPGPHILYAGFFFVLGVWLALRVLRRWKLRKNAFFYFIRAAGYLTVLVAAAWAAAGPRLALFPALGLLFISLSCLVPWGWLKGLLWVLPVFLMFRLLILPEYYQFVYRNIAAFGLAGIKTLPGFLLFNLALIILFAIWSQPFLLGFAAACRSSAGDLYGLKRFQSPIALIPIGVLLIGGAAYLSTLESYNSEWQQAVTVTQREDDQEKTGIEFSSSDFLRGMAVRIDGREESFDTRNCSKTIDYPLDLNWMDVADNLQAEEKEGEKHLHLQLDIAFKKQPYAVSFRLKSDRPFEIDEANVSYSHGKKTLAVRWFSFPQWLLKPEFRLRLPSRAKLDAHITAIFLETPAAVSCTGRLMQFVQRAEISRSIDLIQKVE